MTSHRTFAHTLSRTAGLLLALLALGLAEPRSSAAVCLSTSVDPFPLFDYNSYWVEVVDGDAGDFDGVSDGYCDLRIRFCFGVQCADEPLERFRLFAQAIDGRGLATALRERVLTELTQFAGGELDSGGTSVVFDPPRSFHDTCVTARVRLAAPTGAVQRRTLTLRPFIFFADGRFVRSRRVRTACWRKGAAGGREFPNCRRQTRKCNMADSLGYPPPLPPEMPPPPVTTTTRPPPGTPTTTSTRPRPTTTTTSTTLPPPPPPPVGSTGRTFYLSPTGNNTNSGTSTTSPWRTFGRVLNDGRVLQPGDSLVLLNGTYTAGTTGLPIIDCSAGGNANHGTSAKPITIRAQNERQALLRADGNSAALRIANCRYWVVSGLYGRNSDNSSAAPYAGHVFQLSGVSNVRAHRVLGVHPNRTCPHATLGYCNVHAFSVEESDHVLVEEAELYDYHRHGVGVFQSRYVTVRRTYMNPRYDGPDTSTSGIIFYGSSDNIAENNIAEERGTSSIAGAQVYDGTPGGYRNRILGHIGVRNRYGTTMRARKFGGPVLPVGDNLIRNSVYAAPSQVAVYARGASNTVLENVTIFDAGVDGFRADEDASEDAPCSANPDGCSFRTTNVLVFGSSQVGIAHDPSVMDARVVENTNSDGNSGGDFQPSETITDSSGYIRQSMSVAPGMGLGTNQCLAWVPNGSPMKGAGKGGADIGANILYRYIDGVLTNQRLWDPATGRFPCGAVVAGVNDVAGRSCQDVHRRVNVATNGCAFPPGY